MKAFLINPYNETITEIEDNFDDYTVFYKWLTEPKQQTVTCFCTTRLSDVGDVVYLDDEGFLGSGNKTWTFRKSLRPLAGRGIVCGTDYQGDTVEPSDNVTLDFLRREAVWLRLVSTGEFGPASKSMVNHPLIGRAVHIEMGAPVLAYPEELHETEC